jgi:putative phosphoribosyl transferase
MAAVTEKVVYRDRADAGRRLAEHLRSFAGQDVVVVGLPRGGVPVAFEVARALGAPLDVIVVRKLGVPRQPELAMGAIGEDGVRVVNEGVRRLSGVAPEQLAEVEQGERVELERRCRRLRGGSPAVELAGRVVLVIDDGVATGSTARAACQVARARGAARVVFAAPVGPARITAADLDADEVICAAQPAAYHSVGQAYLDFRATSDDDVARLLALAAAEAGQAADDPPALDSEVVVPVGPVRLPGHLSLPEKTSGVVVFAHGSGSSRHSPRNRFVAGSLQARGIGTMLVDLLTPAEEADRRNVFDIDLLTQRLVGITGWLGEQPETAALRVGYFGASTGAAAALGAAAEASARIAAVVSRGGRPDLAGPRLAAVRAPTLLIVGGNDAQVLELNRAAQQRMTCRTRLEIVPGATHLFEEPGALEAVARLAGDWFSDYLTTAVA